MVKTGACSILLGQVQYGGFFSVKPDMLLKVSKKDERHNEFKYLDKVRVIPNYKDYYSIPEEERYLLNPTDDFYHHIIRLVKYEQMDLFEDDLECYYINCAGNLDVQESLVEMMDLSYSRIWRNYADILSFTHQILKALKFLHERKICHLDIKPENIVINCQKREFRVIDFGFSSVEPFEDFMKNPRGTPGYFPKQFNFEKPTKYLPKIEANDFNMVGNVVPLVKNPKLVYKIDSFCLGRVMHFLCDLFDELYVPGCIYWYGKSEKRVKTIMEQLLENDVKKRKTVEECYKTYFN